MAPSALLAVLRRSQAAGYLGPGPVEEHVEHAAALVAVERPSSYLDLGSGGGVPGLVLATAGPRRPGSSSTPRPGGSASSSRRWPKLDVDDRVRALHARAEDAARDPAPEATSTW